jgi:hypothetical protein
VGEISDEILNWEEEMLDDICKQRLKWKGPYMVKPTEVAR